MAMSRSKKLGLVIVAGAAGVLGYHYLKGLMMLGYVDSAIARVRAIAEAETQFANGHPQSGYKCSMSELPRNEGVSRVVAQGVHRKWIRFRGRRVRKD
jgi:hypothetical protein